MVVTREQISCDLAVEAAVLHLKNGMYYGLDSVGARIWELIQQPRSLGEVRDTLIAEYEVDADRCERDLVELCEKLLAEGLIELQDQSQALPGPIENA